MSLSGKRRKGKVMTPEQETIFREKLKALSPTELEALRDMAQASLMKAHKVTDIDGKKVGAADLRMRSRACGPDETARHCCKQQRCLWSYDNINSNIL